MTGKTDHKNPKRKTPKTYDTANDGRSAKKSGQYPNQHVLKTRSGHTVSYDDSKGSETVTIQHRSGSAIQFLPNGAVQMTAHNGKYGIVFGENRMTITGANDLTVKGDGSMRVYGNYRKTVHGDVEIAATGSIIHTGKNVIQVASENHSIVSQTITHKASDAAQFTANKHVTVAAENAAFIGKENYFAGGTQATVRAAQKLSVESEGKAQLKVAQDFNREIKGNMLSDISQTESKKIGQNEIKQVGGTSNHLVTGTRIVYAQLIDMNGSMPQQAQQLSLFDHQGKSLSPGQGQSQSQDSLTYHA